MDDVNGVMDKTYQINSKTESRREPINSPYVFIFVQETCVAVHIINTPWAHNNYSIHVNELCTFYQ